MLGRQRTSAGLSQKIFVKRYHWLFGSLLSFCGVSAFPWTAFQSGSFFIPKCENLLANYWSWDVLTRNQFLRELIEKAVYTKNTKNTWKNGDNISFSLDIYPKIQRK